MKTSKSQGALAADQKWPGGFGEFLQAVRRFDEPTGARVLDRRLQSALGTNETIPAEGGFLIPAQFSSILMEQITNQTELASRCTTLPVTVGNRITLPGVDQQSRGDGSRWGGVSSAWQNEAALIGASKGKFRSVELNLGKITTASFATEDLMQDSLLLGAFLQLAMPLEAAFKLDNAILRGSGAGQPLGILNSNALITVAKDAGQSAGTLSSSNILGMFARCLPECRKSAVWLVSTEVEEELYALTAPGATTGALLFTPGDEAAPYGRLLNRPVIPVEQCSTIGTVGDIVLAHMPSFLIAQKPVDVALSIHLQFLTGETCFKMVYRVDGQSSLMTPITPYNGGTTKSAFVALAAR